MGSPECKSQTASRSVQPFCRAHNCDTQTDRQTDRPTDHTTRSVTTGRVYVRSTAMRPNNTLIRCKNAKSDDRKTKKTVHGFFFKDKNRFESTYGTVTMGDTSFPDLTSRPPYWRLYGVCSNPAWRRLWVDKWTVRPAPRGPGAEPLVWA